MLYLKSVSVSVIVYNMINHVLENQQEHDSRDKMQWRMEYTSMGRFFLLKESDIRVKAYVVFESEDSAQASLAHNMAVVMSEDFHSPDVLSAIDLLHTFKLLHTSWEFRYPDHYENGIYASFKIDSPIKLKLSCLQSLHDCDSMSEDFHAPYVLSAIDLLHTL
ncbi:hypothetical protein Tco_1231021, partial [Tanacetum coccineum]